MPTVLITGANRGLGLEFVKQYVADGWEVHACCRSPEGAEALRALVSGSDRVHMHRLDVADFDQMGVVARDIADAAIDVLINNAGVYGDRKGFGEVDYDIWAHTLRVNTMAPLRMTEVFVDHVARSQRKQVVHVTSKMGSIADNGSGGSYVYRSSKAALNMVNKSLALDLAGRGITCAVLHPGWVATDMGGKSAPIQPPESVRGMRRVIEGLTPAQSGKFFEFTGEEIPW